MKHPLFLSLLFSVAAATAAVQPSLASDEDSWKDHAISALVANAEVVLEAKKLVTSGRAYVGTTQHKVVSDTRTALVEDFVFEVNASYGDVVEQIATLTITQTTRFHPRAPMIEYESKLVRLK